MNKKILLAAIPSVIALAAILLSIAPQINAESMIGYIAVLTLLGVAALEYRLSWKRVFGRS